MWIGGDNCPTIPPFQVFSSVEPTEDLSCNIVSMKRTGKEGEFRSNLHRGGSAEVIQLTDEEEIAAVKAAKSMGLGVAGVDLLQSARGPLILEVNSSPGLEGIEKATGKDIAKTIIRYIEKHV